MIVAHDMKRELPRTLASLSPRRQAEIEADDYEIVVVDNGSSEPVAGWLSERPCTRLRVERLDPAPPSPARAANRGIALAEADLVGLIVDGARLASPGLLAGALRAATLAERPVITAPAFHLGSVPHMRAAEIGYDQTAEDALLSTVPWEKDGYELFGIATPAGSSSRGLFGPMGESSSLFMSAALWNELGGLDERFDLPGGGLVNHDLYRRACGLAGVELLELLGEGTFHQYHGGAATSRRFGWDEMHAQYEAIRGERYRPPTDDPLYVGHVHPAVLPFVEHSARLALERRGRAERPADHR